VNAGLAPVLPREFSGCAVVPSPVGWCANCAGSGAGPKPAGVAPRPHWPHRSAAGRSVSVVVLAFRTAASSDAKPLSVPRLLSGWRVRAAICCSGSIRTVGSSRCGRSAKAVPSPNGR